jgi:ABC-type thiamine transport system substrate-binding protein
MVRNGYFFLLMILILGCEPKEDIVSNGMNQDTLQVAVFQNYQNEQLWFDVKAKLEKSYSLCLNLTFFQDIMQEKNNLELISQKNDVLIGLNNIIYFELPDSLFAKFKPEQLVYVSEDYFFDLDFTCIPLGFNYLSFLFAEEINQIPQTFGHLQDKKWKHKIILPNCETTSIGRAALYWSVGLYQETGYIPFWRTFKDNIFLITDTSEEALNRFLIGEAPVCLHFVTKEKENTIAYQIPIEGYYNYIEAVAISKFSQKQILAKSLVNHLLGEQIQTVIRDSKCLLPVHKKILKKLDTRNYKIPNFNVNKKLNKNRIILEKDNWLRLWTRSIKK